MKEFKDAVEWLANVENMKNNFKKEIIESEVFDKLVVWRHDISVNLKKVFPHMDFNLIDKLLFAILELMFVEIQYEITITSEQLIQITQGEEE